MISGTTRVKLPSSGADVSRVNSGIAMPSFFDPPWVTLRKTSTPCECERGRARQDALPPGAGARGAGANGRRSPLSPCPGWNSKPKCTRSDEALNSGGSGGNGLASMIARMAD